MDNVQKRINYYLNNLTYEKNVNITFSDVQTSDNPFPPNIMKSIKLNDIVRLSYRQRDNFTLYGPAIVNIMSKDIWFNNYIDKKILFRWGDCTINPECDDLFYITKARRCDSKNGIILKMSSNRHWNNIYNVKNNETSFNNKKNILVWRGATTGEDDNSFESNRLLAVNTMIDSDNCDVGFSLLCQGKSPDKKLLKKSMSLKEQLEYKYLLSLEGNDVASGLKWQLYSDSVVFMRKPRIVSWAMEDTLEPYVHYIPLKDDFSDFEKQVEWANNNQDKCKEISENATRFIEQFLNPKLEMLIQNLVLKKYIESVTVN